MTNDSVLMVELLLEKLERIGSISTKKMFGGHGVFHNGKIFGMVDSKGQAFLKASENNKAEFEQNGSQKHGKMPYYSIPEDILADSEKLLDWAEKSIAGLK
ncbi:TfoX/Sxy family protein [Maribacter halichondriae]|uniref:TfoX/Sxy family protein n=1 Tax=Maribacter halichondriae TaxID=2980554 RepID=UPI00235A0E11|nr:TfoX/Sxy family protein [Maribacter sp. Hal144]